MIVSLTGRAGSGKTTIANMLVDDYGFTAVSLADPLREILEKLDPWVMEAADMDSYSSLCYLVSTDGWDEAKRQNPAIRGYMQNLGQAIRDLSPDFFVMQAEARVEQLAEDAGGNDLIRVVIPDVRFSNEARWFRSGARDYIWRVVGRAEENVRDDVSEHGIPDRLVDFTIHNTASLDTLRSGVAGLLEHMGVAA